MSRKLHGAIKTILILSILLLAIPRAIFAAGGQGGNEKEVNGYHVSLSFTAPARSGENQFQIQITDAMGIPVTNAQVEVSAMPVEGMPEMEMEAAAPAVGVMTSNSSGMDMGGDPAAATGVMKPNNPAANAHAEDAITLILKPAAGSGEYAGDVHFDTSGQWMFEVHFTVNGETSTVEFPFEVQRALGLNYAVLAGFLGFNGSVLAAAAILKKRKPVVARK